MMQTVGSLLEALEQCKTSLAWSVSSLAAWMLFFQSLHLLIWSNSRSGQQQDSADILRSPLVDKRSVVRNSYVIIRRYQNNLEFLYESSTKQHLVWDIEVTSYDSYINLHFLYYGSG